MRKARENDLHLPVIEKEPEPHPLRSIDEINEWIEHDYRLFFNRKVYEKEKKKNSVNSIFHLS